MREEFEVWFKASVIASMTLRELAWASWQEASATYERKHAASQIVPAKCSPDCTHKVSDGPGVCMSAFCAMKFDEERMDIIGQNGNDGEHYQ
jgi:hypothetical protein